jgi:CHAT domain-containing protein
VLAAASELARMLEEATGDGLLREAVAAIEDARAVGDAARLAGLRAGHLAYTAGMERYAVQDLDEARPRLVAARDALAADGSPFAAWPELYLAIIESYTAPEPAFRRLLELRRRLSVDRHPFAVGRIDWNLSTIAAYGNRLEPALAWAQSAVPLLDRSAGPAQSANARLLVSSACRNLGQPERAWRERLAALAAIRRGGEPRRVHVALHETADELLVEGLAATALTVSREVVDQALAWGNSTALANARLQRGRILAELGRGEEALRELAAARGHVAEVPSADLRVRLSASIDLVEGGLLAERDPEAAIELLGRALGAREAQGQRYRVGSFLVDRAQAYSRLDEPDRAETDLRRAVEELEGARGGVRDEALRGSSFETAQEAFEEMVRLQVDRHGDAEAALDYAERARSRLLLDLVGASPGGSSARLPRAASAGEIASRVPAGVVLVEYLVLPERLLTWVVAGGEIRLSSLSVRSAELAGAVAALHLSLRRPSSDAEIRRRAARLHAWLIRPLAEAITPGTTLVVVPDRVLTRVPFAALVDGRTGRALVDDHTLVVAPSATLYLSALERSDRAAASPSRDVLVLGNPAFDRALHPRLDPLPDAAAEAAEIAALYEEPVLLRGGEATASAFLARAPDHRIVHFAGHSLLDPGMPSRSRLLFAAEPGGSGALYAQALAGVRLTATELVVLSACRTVEGSAASRESLTGLAAALLAAGPPVVIASLWKADDEATRVLMVAFHRELRRGADPASALRAAQRRLARDADGRFRSPAYWAGFVAIGGPSVREN